MTSKLDRVSLREQISAQIRAEIMAGGLEPDEIYSARNLAVRFGVSSTPVREAMMDLEAAGLVVPVPNRGFRVVAVRDADLRELAELRLMLEVPLVGRAAVGATASEISRLRSLIERLDSDLASENYTGFLDTDRALHLAYAQMSRNSRAPGLVAQLRDQVRVAAVAELARAHGLTRTVAVHRTIVEAIAARDAATAMNAMTEHLQESVGLLIGQPDGVSMLRPL